MQTDGVEFSKHVWVVLNLKGAWGCFKGCHSYRGITSANGAVGCTIVIDFEKALLLSVISYLNSDRVLVV